MSNHLHLLLRSRPDVVQEWNDNEVAPSVADAVSGAAGSEASPAGAIGVLDQFDPKRQAETGDCAESVSNALFHCLTNSPTHETTSTTVSPDGLRREHRVPDTALNCQSGPDQSVFVRVQKS